MGTHEGEWDAVSARFGPTGALLPLPERVTPQAFKEWEQQVFEWRGRVRVAPSPEPGGGLRSSLTRFWPTVGCEFGKEDAVDGAGEERTLLAGAAGFPTQRPAAGAQPQQATQQATAAPRFVPLTACGFYADAPPSLPPPGGAPLRVELCIVDVNDEEEDSGEATQDGGPGALRRLAERIRVVLSLVGIPALPGASDQSARWAISDVEMSAEARSPVLGDEASQPVRAERGTAEEEETEAAAEAAASQSDGPPDGWATGGRTRGASIDEGTWEACGGASVSLVRPPSAPPSSPSPPPLPPSPAAAAAAARVASAAGSRLPPSASVVAAPYWAMQPRPQWSLAPRAAAVGPANGAFIGLPLGCWAYVEQAMPGTLIIEAGRLLTPSTSPTVASASLGCEAVRCVCQVSYVRGAIDSFVMGRDARLTPAMAIAKGYIQSADPEEQAFYENVLDELGLAGDGDEMAARERHEAQDADEEMRRRERQQAARR